jgi:hypothetical protein
MAIALANTAFTNSGVLIRFLRVGAANEINYNEATLYGGLNGATNYLAVLCDLTKTVDCATFFGVNNNRTAPFNALRAKRDAVGADLVVLMRKQGTACGQAWVPSLSGAVSTANQNLGYSVVTSTKGGVYNCIEGNTLAHETGHNQGMNHDRIQHKLDYGQPNPPASQFNFGYVNKTAATPFFTIMAYRSSCGNGCTRIPFFSTPLKKFSNKPVGIPQGTANAADAAKLLNQNKGTVSLYR